MWDEIDDVSVGCDNDDMVEALDDAGVTADEFEMIEDTGGESAELSESVVEECFDENPLQNLELPEEFNATDAFEPMQISSAEYERMLDTYDADTIANALYEGRFEVVDDTVEDDSPKVLTRFPDVNFEESEYTECVTEKADIEEDWGGITEEDEVTEDNQEVEELLDYESILREIEEESLRQGFENIDIETDETRLRETLDDFKEEKWDELSLEGQKEAMENLADYVKDVIKLENPPRIEYYNREKNGEYGGYNPATNVLNINEYMLYNSEEAADTIAHELWHAHQYECAKNPQSALDYQYAYNIDNYISSDMGQEAYENQLIEAEARAFAEQFKEKIGRAG